MGDLAEYPVAAGAEGDGAVFVGVGEAVSVLRGVGVNVAVGVEVGKALTVCVAAAFAVCTMKVLTAPGSMVGTAGAPTDGMTHADITISMVAQINSFFP